MALWVELINAFEEGDCLLMIVRWRSRVLNFLMDFRGLNYGSRLYDSGCLDNCGFFDHGQFHFFCSVFAHM